MPALSLPALHELLRRTPVSQQARCWLLARLFAPGRPYHGAAHIALLWRRHRRFSRGTPYRAPRIERLIASAIAFHDAVYDATSSDNEAASARLFLSQSRSVGSADRDWVADTIRATADHLAEPPPRRTTPRACARLWMLDLDLSPLGERPLAFAHNTEALRREYGHMAEEHWEDRRREFLDRLGRAPRLYRTRRIASAFAARAAVNLRNGGVSPARPEPAGRAVQEGPPPAGQQAAAIRATARSPA
jgi:predicted metal-dependent HD superfamily phosphohydrolase